MWRCDYGDMNVNIDGLDGLSSQHGKLQKGNALEMKQKHANLQKKELEQTKGNTKHINT